MEIITEVGPGSGEGGFCPFFEWAACFSKPVNYISQHSLCLPSFQSLCVITGPVILPLIVILLPRIAFFPHPALKTQNKTQAVSTGQSEAICYATVVHGAASEARHWRWRHRKQSELLFFFCSASTEDRGGLGSITLIIVRRTMNGAYWKIRLFLKPDWWKRFVIWTGLSHSPDVPTPWLFASRMMQHYIYFGRMFTSQSPF